MNCRQRYSDDRVSHVVVVVAVVVGVGVAVVVAVVVVVGVAVGVAVVVVVGVVVGVAVVVAVGVAVVVVVGVVVGVAVVVVVGVAVVVAVGVGVGVVVGVAVVVAVVVGVGVAVVVAVVVNPTHEEILLTVRRIMTDQQIPYSRVATACGRSREAVGLVVRGRPGSSGAAKGSGKRPSLDLMLGFFEVCGIRVILPE